MDTLTVRNRLVWSVATQGRRPDAEVLARDALNDCTRVYVDKANVQITRIRDDAKKQLDGMTEDATGRIRWSQVLRAVARRAAVRTRGGLPGD